MNKKFLIFLLAIVLVVTGFYLLTSQDRKEQEVLESTYDISKEYLSLRYRTDNLLINAKEYTDYSTWNEDMTQLIEDWEVLEKESLKLEDSASKTAESLASNFKIVQTANAYSAKEISNIYDKAPKFKGISTLANHLGVDAKKAQVILNQAQAEIRSEVFTEEGNAFETLENTAIVIKDGCKVTGFVGGVVLTGGAVGLASAGALTQAGVVVVGSDLALEVTEDGAQIAFGDKNKVSSFVKDVRTVTEPIAAVISITNIPSNLSTPYEKFDSVMIGLEQFRASAQEGKVIGVDLTNFEYQKPFQRIRQAQYSKTVTVAEMEMAEVEEWLKSLNKEYKPMTQEEVEDFLVTPSKEVEQEEEKVEEQKEGEENEKEVETNLEDIPNQIYKVVNVSDSSYMMDVCLSSTCWDDLDADPAEDRDLGGIYTWGKVYGPGESFKSGFRPSDLKANSQTAEMLEDGYRITVYFAIAPFEGSDNELIYYGTWLSESVEISAKYGDEPVIEWDGSSLKQVK